MPTIILEALLRVLLVLPIATLCLTEKSRVNFLRIILFALCYLSYEIVIVLPRFYKCFDTIQSSWNWDGKIYGILLGMLLYLACNRLFKENNFFTFTQYKKGLKQALLGAISIVVLSTIIWFILGKATFNLETLAFQLSVPGIDEEILYRGVLLGLLSSSLKQRISFWGNPSILITAMLFGLMHALCIDKSNYISFDIIYFIQTGVAGYIWGWITIKSRSLLLAVLSHNLSNFLGTLATMV